MRRFGLLSVSVLSLFLLSFVDDTNFARAETGWGSCTYDPVNNMQICDAGVEGG